LAAGIAHNFNNVLMGIQGRASLMIMDKDPSHPDYKHLNGIEESVRSAAELTRDLLGFARGGKYEPKPTDLNTLIKHENMMFGRTKKEIQVHGNYNKDLWAVEVDRGQRIKLRLISSFLTSC
jgi:two-component system cell cycle sensor histidine kinase/response regulator CckA